MKPGRRRAPGSLPIGMLMAQVILVIAVVLVFGAYRQNSENGVKSAEVLDRQAALDRRQTEMDQRSSSLDGREDALNSQADTLAGDQKALNEDRAKLTEDDAALSSREQALTEGKQALADERAALDAADADLKAREQALKDKQADYDAKLSDYASLQQAVDDALNARGRIASAMKAAFAAAGVSVVVDEDGAASVPVGALFTGNSTVLSKDGKELLDRLIPAWYGSLKGENLAALSVEISAASDDSQALGTNARRSLAILEYARQIPSLGADARAALLTTGLSGARAAPDGDARAVFRFYLNNDALKTARAG